MSENYNEDIPRAINRWRGYEYMNTPRSWRGGRNFRSRPPHYGRIFPPRRGWFRGRGRMRPPLSYYPPSGPPMLPQDLEPHIQMNTINPANNTSTEIDEQLSATIDTVKKRLVERKSSESGDTIIEDTQLADPQSPIVKTSQKRRIEHTNIPMKYYSERKINKHPTGSPKCTKTSTSSNSPKAYELESQHWRKKILKQLFSLNMDKLKCLANNPNHANEYNPVLQAYLKQARRDISNQLRNAAEQSLFENDTSAYSIQGKKLMQDAFMGQLGKMLDTDVCIELENMSSQLIKVLSNVLQEDLLIANNDDDESIKNLSNVINDPNIESTDIKFDIDKFEYESCANSDTAESLNAFNSELTENDNINNTQIYNNEQFSAEDYLNNLFCNADNSNENIIFDTDMKENKPSIGEDEYATKDPNFILQNSPGNSVSIGTQSEKLFLKDSSSQTENIDDSIINDSSVTSVDNLLVQLRMIDNDIDKLMQQKFNLYKLFDKISNTKKTLSAHSSNGYNKRERKSNKRKNKQDGALETTKMLKANKISYSESENNNSSFENNLTPMNQKDALQNENVAEDSVYEHLLSNFNIKNRTNVSNNCFIPFEKIRLNLIDLSHLQNSEQKALPNVNVSLVNPNADVASEIDISPHQAQQSSSTICKSDDQYDRDAKFLGTFLGHQDSIIALECIGDTILAASLDGHVYVYCFNTKLLKVLKVSEMALSCILLNACSATSNVYIGSLDSTLKCYNYKTGKQVEDLQLSSSIRCMHKAWGNIYLGMISGLLIIYKIKAKKILEDKTISFSDTPIFDIQSVKEGPRKVLIIGSRFKAVTINDAKTGLLLRLLKEPSNINSINILSYYDNKIYTGTNGKSINIFDFHTGDLLDTHERESMTMCMKIYKGLFFTGSMDGQINVFQIDSHNSKSIICLLDLKIPVLKFSIEDDKIIVSCSDKSLTIWKLPANVLDLMK